MCPWTPWGQPLQCFSATFWTLPDSNYLAKPCNTKCWQGWMTTDQRSNQDHQRDYIFNLLLNGMGLMDWRIKCLNSKTSYIQAAELHLIEGAHTCKHEQYKIYAGLSFAYFTFWGFTTLQDLYTAFLPPCNSCQTHLLNPYLISDLKSCSNYIFSSFEHPSPCHRDFFLLCKPQTAKSHALFYVTQIVQWLKDHLVWFCS